MTVNVHDEDLALQELVVFLKNNDVFSITERGVTTETENKVFSANTTYTLVKPKVKNVRSITVDAVALSLGTDYEVEYSTGIITFVVAQTGAGIIVYDYGDTDKIYTEESRPDIKLASYPRIAVATTSVSIEDGATDGNINYTDYLFSFYTYATGSRAVRNLNKKVRELILLNKKKFYYLRYITPVRATGIIQEPGRNDKVVTKVLECVAPYNEEIIT